MNLDYLDKDEYRYIPLLKMEDNMNGNLPFFVRRYSARNKLTQLHRHKYMQINYIYRGRLKHAIKNNEFEVIKGNIFVIPPYVPHRLISIDGNASAEIFEFEFNVDFINESFHSIENVESFLDFAYLEPFLVSESDIKPSLNLSGAVQVEVEDILNSVLREYTDKQSGFILMVKAQLLKLLVIVGREFTSDIEQSVHRPIFDRHRDAIYNAIKFIDNNYNTNISIEDAAKVSMLSQSYFCYLFKSITSKTFIEYLNRLRISKALDLLSNTDNKVLDICYEIGFNNVNHFNRMFKQQTGTSPLIYRKMNGQTVLDPGECQ